jgi:hypothetical protein
MLQCAVTVEPQQLGQLASCVPPVVARGCQGAESFDVFASCAMADESAGDGIACANPGGSLRYRQKRPIGGVEAFDCRFEPCLRFGQVGPGVTLGDGVKAARAWSHREPPMRFSNCEPTSTRASRRTARQDSRPPLVFGPASRRSSPRS